jgi:hypothetical protein
MIDLVIPWVDEAGNEMPHLESQPAPPVQSHAPEADLSEDDIPF